jgi:aryl-alcohol dehydrogenase-like predicted oxidoreductase
LVEGRGFPRIVSIQNPYNLLNRSYEIGLAEIAHREQVGLLAYSPLAFGVLTGKYLGNKRPGGARLSLFKRFDRYSNIRGTQATARYAALATEHGLTPTALALAFVNSRPFLTSNIIGATSLEQLGENIDAAEIRLGDEVLAAIESIHEAYPNPCP